jgi:hypothetical protein
MEPATSAGSKKALPECGAGLAPETPLALHLPRLNITLDQLPAMDRFNSARDMPV